MGLLILLCEKMISSLSIRPKSVTQYRKHRYNYKGSVYNKQIIVLPIHYRIVPQTILSIISDSFFVAFGSISLFHSIHSWM